MNKSITKIPTVRKGLSMLLILSSVVQKESISIFSETTALKQNGTGKMIKLKESLTVQSNSSMSRLSLSLVLFVFLHKDGDC